jgi:hypothetical protein
MQQTQYTEATVSQLLYSRTPKVVKAIKERQVATVFYPRGARGGYGPQKTIEFDIKSDMLLDLPTFNLSFKSVMSGHVDSVDCEIASALDFIGEISAYYNDTELFRYQQCSAWQTQFLLHNANKNYLDNDLNVLTGWFDQFSPVKQPVINFVASTVTYSRDNVKPHNRTYTFALGLLHPFFNMSSFLPIFGNTLRVKLLTNTVNDAISLRKNAADTFTLDEVEISGDIVVVKSDYAKQIMSEMANGVIRLSYLSFECGRMNVANATINNLKYLFNLSNLLSIFLLRNENTKKQTVELNKHKLVNHSFDTVRDIANLKVKTGSLYLTEPSGIDSDTKFYIELQKCLGDVGVDAISGKGVIDYGSWAVNDYVLADLTANPHVDRDKYPSSLIGINCEKLVQDDNEGVVNSGLSSVSANATNEIQFTVETGSALAATDEYYINLCHRRALVFENGAYTVEA